jgi:hypothetical protein
MGCALRVPRWRGPVWHVAARQSAEQRDVEERLNRALASCAALEAHAARPVQLFGQAHRRPETYARWRQCHLRRLPGASAPELPDGSWALVLWALEPAMVLDFLRQGRSEGLLTPPAVGTFAATVDSVTALASAVAAWLEDNGGPLRLAPPLLSQDGGRPRLAALARSWPLPPAVPCRLD